MTSPPLFYTTSAITASPADDAETVVATLTGVCSKYAGNIFKLSGEINLDVDTDCDDVQLAIRRGSLAGAIVAGPFGVIGTATGIIGPFSATIAGIDSPGDAAGAVYVLTVECVNATGTSTVAAVSLTARVD